MIAVSGVGLLGAGAFATDPANGFPPGTPLIPLQRTTGGILHDLFGATFIFDIPIAAIVFAWTLAFVVVAVLTFQQGAGIVGRLQQPGDHQRLPGAQGQDLFLFLEPGREPGRGGVAVV